MNWGLLLDYHPGSGLRPPALRASLFPFVPIQILDGCLQGILPLFMAAAAALSMIKPAPNVPESNRTWLPTLQQFPPHSWIDSLVVTAKAIKQDDAAALTQLWDAIAHWCYRMLHQHFLL
jgi:hypothetical protein